MDEKGSYAAGRNLPKMVEASDDQYDVIEKFHDCDYELRDTGAMISYVLDSQS